MWICWLLHLKVRFSIIWKVLLRQGSLKRRQKRQDQTVWSKRHPCNTYGACMGWALETALSVNPERAPHLSWPGRKGRCLQLHSVLQALQPGSFAYETRTPTAENKVPLYVKGWVETIFSLLETGTSIILTDNSDRDWLSTIPGW